MIGLNIKMAIKQEITQWEFVDRFKKSAPDNFTNRGLETLYLYLYELSEEIGEDIELDIIAICCEYAEYDNLEELMEDYGQIIPTYTDKSRTLETLKEYTNVIEIHDSTGLIIQQF